MPQILFVHQNFPGQYRYLVRHFAKQSDWQVFAVGEKSCVQKQFHLVPSNVTLLGYELPEPSSATISSRLSHFSNDVDRADALEKVLLRQKK